MEKVVIFRDYMEQQAQDYTDLQAFAKQSLDHVVYDAVTATRRFAGFATVKTAQTEVQVQPGRFYDILGAVYSRSTVLTQSVIQYLPAVSKRIVAITVYGAETETDVEERDFLVDVDTGRTEPDAVATTRSRDAVIAIVVGTESADPQPPAIPTTSVAIAYLLLDPTSIVSVTMLTDNEVASTEELDLRADALETFKSQIEPRVSSLASDLAALAAKVASQSSIADVARIYTDLAEVKAKVNIPSNFSNWGANFFLDLSDSDSANSLNRGYDALVEMGLRFPAANEDEAEMGLASAYDDKAALATNGLLLPAYTDELKLSVGTFYSAHGIGEYGYRSYTLNERKIRKERLRYGGQYSVCSNGVNLWTRIGQDQGGAQYLPDFSTYQTVTKTAVQDTPWHVVDYYDYYWHDSWSETYWTLDEVQHTITGGQVSQSFLVANDMWATKLGFYVDTKAAAENIVVSLCECTLGMPDVTKVILHQTHLAANITLGWNRIAINPVFLERGKRYAMILTSNANHKVGMASGQQYTDGTFFYSDGAYQLGDPTLDMMFEVWGAKFTSSQCTIDLAMGGGAVSLDGGFRSIDITAGCIVPESCKLVYEIKPTGGSWTQLTAENALTLMNGLNAPTMAQGFRARFIGTRDVQPGLMLAGSRIYLSRPKLAFKHISKVHTVTSTTSVYVKVTMERWVTAGTPHTLDCVLRVNGTTNQSPASTTDRVLDAPDRIERTFHFTPSATTTFDIELAGTTNSATLTFHVAECLFYTL